MKMSEVDINMLSPMMKEYYKTKSEYMDVLLFYRLGDFYEMFFEDAITASHELELTLTGKNAGFKRKSTNVWSTTSCSKRIPRKTN